ncbi:MAG: hypothetical protein GX575_03510 [Candidatus Anammoximicrobium sp.]|nr:hypothetical protein [Candidatus Anammoximicrobium sp.]
MLSAGLIAVLLGAEAGFEVAVQRVEDRVDIRAGAERVVLTLVSPRGIGAATVRRRGARWPKTVTLRLQLRGLEWLTVAAGKVTLGVSVSSSAPEAVRLFSSETGKPQKETVERGSCYWTQVRVLDPNGKPASGLPGAGGWFEVQLPAALLKDNPESVAIRWIDFYRN